MCSSDLYGFTAVIKQEKKEYLPNLEKTMRSLKMSKKKNPNEEHECPLCREYLVLNREGTMTNHKKIGRASCRERV